MELTMAKIHSWERAAIGASLGILTALAWAYMAMPMTMAAGSGLSFLGLGTVMWMVMMAAMMLPGAAPMIMTYIRVHQRRRQLEKAAVPTWLFMAGYLAVWAAFGAVAAVAQWALHANTLMTSAMGHLEPLLGGLPAGCRWGFPVQLSKTSLLEQMPVTHNLPDDGMARRRNRCLYNGSPPWRLLHRLLLGADAANVRRRSDEPGLDGSACALFPGGETGALAANV